MVGLVDLAKTPLEFL